MSTAHDSLPPMPALPRALLDEVRRDCEALARDRRKRLAGFTGLAVAVVIGFGFAMGWKDSGFVGPGCGSPLHTLIVGAFGVIGLSLVALAFGLALPTGRTLRAVPVIGLGLGLAGLAGIAVLFGQPMATGGHGGLGCLTTGGIVSLALVGLALLLGRRVIRRHAPSAGLFGVGVGLLALIPLSMGCHDASMFHLMLWHGLIPVVGGLAGILMWRIARPD